MRLLFGTHSARGVEVFRDVQEKVERTEIETRSDLLESRSRQTTLFPDDMVVAMTLTTPRVPRLRAAPTPCIAPDKN